MWILNFIFYKKANRFLLLMTFMTTLGMILFGLLFYQALEQHDYYVINQMILVPMTALTFFDMLKRTYPGIFNALFTRVFFLIIIIPCVFFTRTHIEYRYSPAGWENENRTRYTYGLETIEPYLHSVGIEKDDRVICGPDHSINISLYLMNRKGWTRFNLYDDSLAVAAKIRSGADFLVNYDKDGLQQHWLTPFTGDKIGQYENISVYRLDSPDH